MVAAPRSRGEGGAGPAGGGGSPRHEQDRAGSAGLRGAAAPREPAQSGVQRHEAAVMIEGCAAAGGGFAAMLRGCGGAERACPRGRGRSAPRRGRGSPKLHRLLRWRLLQHWIYLFIFYLLFLIFCTEAPKAFREPAGHLPGTELGAAPGAAEVARESPPGREPAPLRSEPRPRTHTH